MMDSTQDVSAIPAHVRLKEMGAASVVASIVHVAAKLGLADHLADGPRSADDLARSLNLHAPSLGRLLRTLAGLGILTAHDDRRFALTPLGEAMRSGAAGAARETLLMQGSAPVLSAFAHFMHSLETGRTGFEEAQGMPFFDYLARHPDEASIFSGAMVGLHGAEPPAVAAAYDFSVFNTVADIGGATGNMLAAILAHHPTPRGLLFDRPHVVAGAPTLLRARGVADRVDIKSGNFFEGVPRGANAYILSHILHDWSDEQCLIILRNCRDAIPADGRLLIVEMVLPPGDIPHPGKTLDMIMLVLIGGLERSAAEYAALLDRSGFRLARVVPTETPASIIEALAV